MAKMSDPNNKLIAENRRARFDYHIESDLEAGIALTGQVAGRITSVKPVQQIFEETLAEYFETIGRLPR